MKKRKRSHGKQKVITTKVDTYFENLISFQAHLRYIMEIETERIEKKSTPLLRIKMYAVRKGI